MIIWLTIMMTVMMNTVQLTCRVYIVDSILKQQEDGYIIIQMHIVTVTDYPVPCLAAQTWSKTLLHRWWSWWSRWWMMMLARWWWRSQWRWQYLSVGSQDVEEDWKNLMPDLAVSLQKRNGLFVTVVIIIVMISVIIIIIVIYHSLSLPLAEFTIICQKGEIIIIKIAI